MFVSASFNTDNRATGSYYVYYYNNIESAAAGHFI